MPQEFAIRSHLHEMSDDFDILSADDKSSVLVDAAERIETILADSDYLKKFTHNGKQAFYNDHSNDLFSTAGYHLSDNFYVSIDPTETIFIISNDKTVHSKTGHSINLFDQLLWPGFGRYRVPTVTGITSREMENYYFRTKAMTRKFYKIGGPLIKTDESNLMSFYYRYAGKSFYNMVERRGMDTGLHTKFKSYITGAIEKALKDAIESHLGSSKTELA